VILYTQADFEAEVKRLTEGRGVDVVYDSVGQTTFLKGIECLRPRGMMVLFGQSSGPVDPVSPSLLQGKGSLFLTRPTLIHHTLTRDELLGRAADVFGWLRDGTLKLTVHGEYALADAAAAHEAIESRDTIGKLILVP
jgi:NADPH2:quinone reductase